MRASAAARRSRDDFPVMEPVPPANVIMPPLIGPWRLIMRKTILAVATLAGLAAIPMNANAQSSTVGGALIGAGAGAVIGGAVTGRSEGAAVGAVIGGTTGAA